MRWGCWLLVGVLSGAPAAGRGQAVVEPLQQFASLGELKLESGAAIHDCRLGYRTLGTLNGARSNAILYPSWFSGNSAAMIKTVGGAAGYFDPSPYFVIFVDALGDGVSCSPSNSVSQHGTAFPEFTIRDMVYAEYRLVTEKLGLTHLRAVMGGSMGGMQTFQWIVSYPEMMDVAIPMVGTPRQSSYDRMLWLSEEAAMLADSAYKNGSYAGSPGMPVVQLIHNMNLATPQFRAEHTAAGEFEGFFRTTEGTTNGAFDANDWRWQIHAMLAQDIAKGLPGDSLNEAADKVKARVLIINARQDHMVNPLAALAFAPLIHAKVILLEGDCGHLAPGCEVEKVRPAVDEILRLGR